MILTYMEKALAGRCAEMRGEGSKVDARCETMGSGGVVASKATGPG